MTYILFFIVGFFSNSLHAQEVYQTGGPSYWSCKAVLLQAEIVEPAPVRAVRPNETEEAYNSIIQAQGVILWRVEGGYSALPREFHYFPAKSVTDKEVITLTVALLDMNFKHLFQDTIAEALKAFESHEADTSNPPLTPIATLAKAVTVFNLHGENHPTRFHKIDGPKESIKLIESIPVSERLHPAFNWHLAEAYYKAKDYKKAQDFLIFTLRQSLLPKYSPDEVPSQTLLQTLEEVSSKVEGSLPEDIVEIIRLHKKTDTFIFFDDTQWGPYLVGYKGEGY